MAEAQVALDTSSDRSNHYSRPVFKQVLKVNSLQAQRVMERSFERVSNSLFSIDVILRIIGEQDEIDQVETVILERVQGLRRPGQSYRPAQQADGRQRHRHDARLHQPE